MLKAQQPFLFKGSVQDPSFGLERLNGEQVVSHNVGERQMRHSWDQIAEEEGHLPFRFDLHALMAARVAGGDDGGNSGK